VIGEPSLRREDDRLLRGKGVFVDDLPLPGALHMAVVRSTRPHARIVAIDVDEALKIPGVIGVYTASDIAEINAPWPVQPPHPSSHVAAQRVLPVDKVRYVGEAIAVVVAEDRYIAEDAVDSIMVDYEPLEGYGTMARALEGEDIHEIAPGNIAAHVVQEFGDTEAALQTASHVIHESFQMTRGGGHSMEGRAVAARYDEALGIYLVWDSTQVPYQIRSLIAYCFGLPVSKIRVIAPKDVGGGFGPKTLRYPEEVLVPWLARKLGRPVKYIEDRWEHFVSCGQEHPMEHEVTVAFDDEGRLLALRDVFLNDAGSFEVQLTGPLNCGPTIPGPYHVPNMHIEFRSVYTNKSPGAPVRGAGRPQGVFVMERMMDRIAETLKLDPVEVRRRNLIQSDEFPYNVGLVFRDGSPMIYDSGAYPELLEKALEAIGYEEQRRRAEEAQRRGVYRGVGVAVAVEGCGMGPFEGATVRIDTDGSVTLVVATPPQGQGHETTFAQICSEALGLPAERIRVETGDTGGLPYGVGTFASRAVVNAGPAVTAAAREVRDKLVRAAGAIFECAPEDVEIYEGNLRVRGVPSAAISVTEVASLVNAGRPAITLPEGVEPGLVATSFFRPQRAVYSSSVQACVVEVDPEAGEVSVLEWVIAHDCGRMINPLLVKGQILGGAAHGLSHALYEASRYTDDGEPLTTSYLDYPIPSACEMPRIVLVHQETLSPMNPLGVKGAGEAGILGVPAAIANAVEDALRPFGVRITQFPLSRGLISDLIAHSSRREPRALQ
jgi:carbon-monoxide dehydrogenase large subunit